MKYHTNIVFALKNELMDSLLTFSSGKVLICRQTLISFGVPVQSLCSKDENVLSALQMAVEIFVCSRMCLWHFWGSYDSEWVILKKPDETGLIF